MWNEISELAVLGCAMSSRNGYLIKLLHSLREDDFYRPFHRDLYISLREMKAANKRIYKSSVVEHMKEAGRLAHEKMRDYLDDVEAYTIYAPSFDEYLAVVKKFGQCRRVIDGCKEVPLRLQGLDDLDGCLESLKSLTRPYGDSGLLGVGDLDIERRVPGVPVFIKGVNRSMHNGGWARGQVSLIGAMPGGGKTTIMLQDFKFAADRGERVVYATFGDLTATELMQKVMYQETGYTSPDMMPNGLEGSADWQKELGDWKIVKDVKFYQANRVQSGMGRRIDVFMDEMRLYREKGPIDRIYVDYVQRVQPDERYKSQFEGLERVSHCLKVLSEELNVALIAGTQLMVDKDDGVRPKGCGAFFEDASAVVYMQWHKETDKNGEDIYSWARVENGQPKVRARLMKNRFGVLSRSDMSWNQRYAKFEEN